MECFYNMFKKFLVGTSLLASIIGCSEPGNMPEIDNNFNNQLEAYLKSFHDLTEEIDAGLFGTCKFETAIDLESYIKERINDRIVEVVDIHNEKFGFYLSAKDINVEYRYFEDPIDNYPTFHYDFEKHKLILEMFPENNPDEYVRSMCIERDKMWNIYETFTVGFVPHELAHLYHDRFMMRHGINWGRLIEDSPRQYGAGLVAEGVAIYVASTIDPTESLYKKEEYANPYEHLMAEDPWPIWIYPAGEKFVRPILDIDFESGLEFLSRDLPQPRSAHDIEDYQTRILRRLNR